MLFEIMKIILITLFCFFMNIGSELILEKRKKELKSEFLKVKTLISPIAIFLPITFIYFTDLTWTESGFQIGELNLHLLVALFTVGVIIIIQFVDVLRSTRSELKKARKEDIRLKKVLTGNQLYIYIYTLILVGPAEEILFRSFFQAHLQRFFPGDIFTIGYATIIAGIIFGLAHLLNARWSDFSLKDGVKLLPGIIFIGILLGYIFQVSHSIIYPIIAHNLVDGSTILLMLYKLRE